MWPYPWTHVGTPSHLGHMDRVAATMPSQAHAGAAQEAPDIGQWEGQDVPLVRPSSCNVKGGIPSSRRYLPTYLGSSPRQVAWRSMKAKGKGVSVGLPVDRVWNGGSDLQAGVEIYYWEHPEFWLISSSQNDPILGPQFPPSVWSIGGPISLCPQGART